MPESGLIVACGDSAEVRELAGGPRAPVVFYGEDEANAVRLAGRSDGRQRRDPLPPARRERRGEVELAMPLWGVHNAVNALAVWTAGRRDGLGAAELAAALARFRGVKRRQELLADHRGIVVVDDFAHHPTAVEKTLASMRMRYPGRRLLACFEPRSLTAGRAFLLAGYARAFAVADLAYFAPIFHRDRLAPEDRLDLAALAAGLSAAGTPCVLAEDLEALRTRRARGRAAGRCRADDVLRLVRRSAAPARRRRPHRQLKPVRAGALGAPLDPLALSAPIVPFPPAAAVVSTAALSRAAAFASIRTSFRAQ